MGRVLEFEKLYLCYSNSELLRTIPENAYLDELFDYAWDDPENPVHIQAN